jgi:zinc protease
MSHAPFSRWGSEAAMAGPGPQRTVLDNGLVVLTLERQGAPVVAVLITYRAGAFFDPPGLTGLAHLTEHMMFRGTARYPHGRIDALTGRLGGTNNAMTTADHALYYFVLPADHWRTPLEIEADRMLNCELAADAFETERRVAIEERMMLNDDPETILYEAVDALAFDGHPYGRPVVGTLDDIRRITIDDLKSFYRTYYGPGNAVVAVAGDVAAAEVVEAADRLFGDAPWSPAALFAGPTGAPIRGPRIARVSCPQSPPRGVVAFRSPSASDPDAPAVELLAAHFSSGRSSVMYTELVEGSRIATEVSASRLMQSEPGLFYLSASLHDGARPEACEKAILDIVARVRESGLTEDELTKARNLTRVDGLLSLESCLGAAGTLAFWESIGSWTLEDAYERGVSSVDRDGLRNAALKYLSPETRSSAWLTA